MEAPGRADLHTIKNHYQKASECLDAGFQEDEAGNKARAVVLYRLGRRHLLQGLEMTTHRTQCEGADWSRIRQLQVKMNETLSIITTRLAVLENGSGQGASGAQALCPSLSEPQRPARRPCVKSSSFTTASGGSPFLPASPVTTSDLPCELPPAYTPQPTDGHLSLSHSKGKAWPSPPRLKEMTRQRSFNEGGGDLMFLPHGVQIFFVAADGQVSAPSYPGYLRIVLNSSQHSDSSDVSGIGQPPAYLQGAGKYRQSMQPMGQIRLHTRIRWASPPRLKRDSSLKMTRCHSESLHDSLVCDWHYPLFPDSPVLLSNTGVFTFPDTTAAEPGSYVGVVLSPELPAADRALFQEHLSVLTQLRVQAANDQEADEPTGTDIVNLNQKSPISPTDDTPTSLDTTSDKEEKVLPEWSEKISQSILAGASWLSRGLVQGGEVTGKAIHKGATKLRENITPEETPAEVSPRVTRGLQVARQATGGAAKVSSLLVEGLATVVERVGKELAPHVKKHSGKLVPESLKKNKGACSNMDGAKAVAVSSIRGISTLWSGLETAAKTVGKSASSETVQTVKHKYGDEASRATDTAVQSVVNVGNTAFTLDNIVLKAAVKTACRQTSTGVEGEEESMEPEKTAKGKELEKK